MQYLYEYTQKHVVSSLQADASKGEPRKPAQGYTTPGFQVQDARRKILCFALRPIEQARPLEGDGIRFTGKSGQVLRDTFR